MIRTYSRALNQGERSILEKNAAFAGIRHERWKRFCWYSASIALVIGIPLTLWQAGKDPALGYLAFGTLVVYLAIVTWVVWSNTKEDRGRLRVNLGALEADTSQVTHCQSRQVVRIEEGDLPCIFLFEVESDQVLFCEMYAEEVREKQFPNSNFEVAKVYGPHGELVLLELSCTGEIVRPSTSLVGQYSKEALAQLQLPNENFSLMKGRIDQLPELTPVPAKVNQPIPQRPLPPR